MTKNVKITFESNTRNSVLQTKKIADNVRSTILTSPSDTVDYSILNGTVTVTVKAEREEAVRAALTEAGYISS